jgi:CMP-N-acetylneuraminic acid synthetase
MFHDSISIVIPARRNSKGLPYKNRRLIEHCLDKIPTDYHKDIIVSTDDEWIVELCKEKKILIFNRSLKTSTDIASTKSVIEEMKPALNELIIMLYLTYPERKWKDVQKAINFFNVSKSKSLLCSKQIKTSPYLMMYKDGIRGKQIIEHDLFRRQDYPDCFEISHFISIFFKEELDKLNNNMYNVNTVFFPIDDVVDVDTPKDLQRYYEKN